MDINTVIQKLHPLERKIIPYLAGSKTSSELVSKSGLSEVEVMRALQWLSNKEILKINKKVSDKIRLGNSGLEYAEKGLPEERFLNSLSDVEKSSKDIMQNASLSNEEFSVSLGLLKKKGAINLNKKENLLFASINDVGKSLLLRESSEKKLISKLEKNEEDYNALSSEEINAFNQLKSRKEIITVRKEVRFEFALTELGKKLSKTKISSEDFIERLSPELLKSGEWKNKTFRSYDVAINVPQIYGGKRHFVKQAMEYAKKVWLDMGFKEMTGDMIQTSFWNFDALFTPQDHPGRDLQDTYFIKNPSKGNLPDKFKDEVKASHENGGKTGSKGWNYKWDEEDAKKNVLRSHTTVLSAHALSMLGENEMPSKFFAVGRCFRNEAIDWSHLCEFNQTEGIVVDPDANFRNLLGYLKQFFAKMGFPKARFRPAHFPYTEPSVEIDVYHPVHKKWFELGGAGILRPEVVVPLIGKDIPVLAWGPGFDRIILDFYKITDIRDLYKNDIKQLRETKMWRY